jgi:hypothetical protein
MVRYASAELRDKVNAALNARGQKSVRQPTDTMRQCCLILSLAGLTVKQVAAAMGISESSARAHRYALTKLAESRSSPGRPWHISNRGKKQDEPAPDDDDAPVKPKATEPIDIDETDPFLLAVAEGPPPAGFRVARSQWDKLGVYTRACFEPKGFGPVDDHLADFVIPTAETDKPPRRG